MGPEGSPQDVTVGGRPERRMRQPPVRRGGSGEADISDTGSCMCTGPGLASCQNLTKPVWPGHGEGQGAGMR